MTHFLILKTRRSIISGFTFSPKEFVKARYKINRKSFYLGNGTTFTNMERKNV